MGETWTERKKENYRKIKNEGEAGRQWDRGTGARELFRNNQRNRHRRRQGKKETWRERESEVDRGREKKKEGQGI